MFDLNFHLEGPGLDAYFGKGFSASRASSPSELAKKVSAAVPAEKLPSNLSIFCEALWKSRIVKHILFATGVALAVAYLVTPPGWMSAAVFGLLVGFGTLIATSTVNIVLDKKQCLGEGEKLALETSFFSERFCRQNFSQITDNPEEDGNLFVGGLPTKLNRDLTRMKAAGINCVISVNSKWEKENRGPSLPYTRKEYKDAHIEYIELDSVDHQPLSMADMDKISKMIDLRIKRHKNVLIHCRAGKGRSALGVLAYLMKACKMPKDKAAELIKGNRRQSTIKGKKGVKVQTEYEAHLEKNRQKPNPLTVS